MSEPMKVGLVGTGGISNRHMTAYLAHPDRVHLTTVCDIVESRAQEYAKKAGVDTIYLDFEAMLREADIDAVDICTSHDMHAPLAVAAAQAGKHVLVEKAMAHTLQGCRDMIEAADTSGVTLMVAQHLRYSPEAPAVKRFIDEGNLGEIQAVRTHAIMGGGPRPRKGWMSDGKHGGGILMVNSVHHLDLLRYYVGDVKRVNGICRTMESQMANGAEDLFFATLEFKNGAIGDVYGNWTTRLAPEGMSYMVYGSEGTLHSTPPLPENARGVNQFGPIMFALKTEEKAQARAQLPVMAAAGQELTAEQIREVLDPDFEPLPTRDGDQPSTDFFINEILHWEACCRTGAEPISSGRDNIGTMKIIFGILESSRTGRTVDLGDL